MLIEDEGKFKKSFSKFRWEYTFNKFLSASATTEDDVLLLSVIFKFLSKLVPLYTLEGKLIYFVQIEFRRLILEQPCWVVQILKSSTYNFPNLLQVDSLIEFDLKILHQELFNLITVCVWHEQRCCDLHSPKSYDKASLWLPVVNIIADILKFNETQHFYNLGRTSVYLFFFSFLI